MNEQNSRSKVLLNKVYDHLESIDVTKLSMRELQDFLEVVQKGQFLESFGQTSAIGFGNWTNAFNSALKPTESVGESESADNATAE